jgi:hypothetical protein
LYENVVKVFVIRLINVADSYRNNSNPSNTGAQWVSRTGDVIKANSIIRQAVSYSFGGRQTVSAFNSSVSKHGAPSYDDIENDINYSEYQNYNGNIGEAPPDEPSVIRQTHGIVGTGDQKWPGLYSGSEYNAGISGVTRYYHENWAGVDCIGFAIQTLRYAERPASYANSQVLADLNADAISGISIAEVCGSNTCDVTNSIHTRLGLMNTNVNRFFNTQNTNLMYYWIRTTTSEKKIHRGDFVHYNGHISIVYSDNWGESTFDEDGYPYINYDIIHAYGNESYHVSFSRKVILTGNDIPVTPIGFGRIKLWD